MKSLGFGRYALCSCVAVALLAGCGGSQPPVGAPSAMPQSRTSGITTHGDRGGSWMLPEAKKNDLLYVSNGSDEVDVYTYPKGTMVGQLYGFAGVDFMCVDKLGDIFIPSFDIQKVFKYAHGGTNPIAALSDPYGQAVACGVDSVTGDVAVVNAYTTGGPGNIAVYRHAAGTPKIYGAPNFTWLYKFAAYDSAGNLYIEGLGGPSKDENVYAELQSGAKRFRALLLDSPVEEQNGLQWEGTYLAVGSGTAQETQHNTDVFHVKISGKIGTTIGTTILVEGAPTANFAIQGSRVIVAGGAPSQDTKFFPYPGGGRPTKTLMQGDSVGVVVSRAPI